LKLVVAPGGENGALDIRQDVRIYTSILDDGQRVDYSLADGRGAWIQVARGGVTVNGTQLAQGDGAAIENESALTITSNGESELLFFDLR
jgi:quercetin 2,3-dioxygenase